MSGQEDKKTVNTFAAASFLNDLGSDMINPIWPLFVTSFAGVDMAVLGFLDGVGEAVVSMAQAGAGYLSDRLKKRKFFIWIGYLMASLARLGYALSPLWQHVLFFRMLDRSGKIRGTPRDAIVADISTDENRGENFGFLRAMDNLGAFFGIIICILFFKTLGYRNLFLLAAIPSAIGALLILGRIRESPPSPDAPKKKIMQWRDLRGSLKLLIVLSGIFALGSFSYSFLLIFARKLGFAEPFLPVLYMIFTLAASASSMPFGKLSDRIGRKPVLGISFLMWGAVCLMLLTFKSHAAVVLTFVLHGIHRGALDTVQKAYVAELAPLESRASALGLFQMIVGLSALPSSLLAGIMWERISPMAPFLFAIGMTLASFALLLRVKKDQ